MLHDGWAGSNRDAPSEKGEGRQHRPSEQLTAEEDGEQDRVRSLPGVEQAPHQVCPTGDEGDSRNESTGAFETTSVSPHLGYNIVH
jgi:hypothetical protein